MKKIQSPKARSCLALILTIFAVLLMFSSVYGLLGDIPSGHSGSSPHVSHMSADLSSIGVTGSTSITVNYWTNNAVANSGTSSVTLAYSENSTQSTVDFSFSSQLSISSGNATGSVDLGTYYYYANSAAGGIGIILPLPIDAEASVTVGTVTAELYIGDSNYGWSYTFNSYQDINPPSSGYIEIYPSWSTAGASAVLGDKIDITMTSYSGEPMTQFLPIDSSTGTQNPYSYSGTSNSIVEDQSSYPSQASQPFIYGFHFSTPTTATITIPQYESSYDISWSSPSSINPVYNGDSQTASSGTFTGSLTVNSITVNPVGDPPDVSDGSSTYTFSYYLSSQTQVSTATATQTSSPSYTFSQVSGTTNEASASFVFNGSTPSTAKFIPYESASNSLTTDNTNIVFTPTITLDNPYYSYTQNELVASLSGNSTGSYSGSNTENPTMTGNSVTYTTLQASGYPAWTVSLNLYGNVAPTVNTPTASFSNSGSEVSVTFTSSQSVFNGELQTYVVNWGDGTTSTYSNLATGTYTETHTYSGTFQGTFSQTYTIYVEDTNVPNPDSNGLSGLTTNSATTTYTIGMTDNPTTPDSILKVGQSIYMNVTASNLIISGATVSVNGLSPVSASLIKQSGSTYDFKYSSSLFGVSGVTVSWSIDPTGIVDVFSTQYATPIEPTQNSSYVTALFSNSATHSYQVTLSGVPQVEDYTITLSGVPSGSGYYQQLITVNPSDYGISSTGGNVLFFASNGTELYAWLQNINSTSASYWIKNFNSSSTITMQVEAGADYFSANGYLSDTSGANVFPYFQSFEGLSSLPSGYSLLYATATFGSTGITVTQNASASYGYLNLNPLPSSLSGSTLGWLVGGDFYWSNARYVGTSTSNAGSNGGYQIQQTANDLYFHQNNTLVYSSASNETSTYSLYASGSYLNIYYNGASVYTNDSISSYTTSYFNFQTGVSGSLFVSFLASLTYIASMPTYTIGSGTPVTLSNQPTYQQLLTIGNTTVPISHYGINSQGSNIQFTASNGSLLYAWIQSINSSTIQVWVKNYYGNSVVDMQVFPEFENLFSATGYLGNNATEDNGMLVFPMFEDEQTLNMSLNSSSGTASVSIPLSSTFSYGQIISSTHVLTLGNGSTNYLVYNVNGYSYYASGINSVYYIYSNQYRMTGTQVAYSVNSGSYVNVRMNISTSANDVSLSEDYLAWSHFPTSNDTFSPLSSLAIQSLQPDNIIQVDYVAIAQFGSSNTMPTYSIGSGSVLQANATADNTTSQPFYSFTSDGSNLTDGIYTYHIPDSFNSNYITIYYNPAWTVDFASYGFTTGVQATSSGSTMPYISFAGVSGIGTLSVTFIEPITIGEPLGTMSLGVLPSVAIGGKVFFELPADYLHWTANGQPVDPNGFSVVIGKPLTIDAYTAADQVVYNKTMTPDRYDTFLQTYVNISSIEIMNENMNQTLEVQAKSGNLTQDVVDILPFQTQTIYVAGTNYTVSITKYNFTTGQPIGDTQTVTTFGQTGLQWWIAKGVLLSQIQDNINFTRTGVANEINDLKISINLNDSAIKNITTDINVNLSGTNTSIQNQITKIFANFSYQKTLINSENLSISNDISLTQSMIKSFNLNLSDNFTITDSEIKNANISQSDRFKILGSSLGNLTYNTTDYFSLTKDAIKNLNLNLSDNFTLTNDIIKNANISQVNRFNILKSNVGNLTFNVSNDYILEHDSIKDLNLNLSQNFTLTNDFINNANISQTNKFNILHSSVGNLTFNVSNYYTLEKDSIKNLNLNLSDNFSITDSILNNVNISQTNKFSIMKSYVGNLTFNVTNYYNLEHDAIKTLNLNLSQNFTLTNDIIQNANISQTNKYDILKSTVGNLTFNVTSYYNLENNNITHLNLSISNKITLLNDALKNLNITFNDSVAILNSTLNNVNLNATTYFQIEHDIMNSLKVNQTDIYHAAELSGAYSYKLIPENVTTVPGGIELQLWVTNHDGTIVDNPQLVYFLWKNMSAEIISVGGQNATRPILLGYNAHYMTVEFSLSPQEVNDLKSGTNNTVLQMFSPFTTGGIGNIATGSIEPQAFPAPQLTWYEQYLGFKSPPPPGFIPEVKWIILSIPGFLSVGILGALVSIYYLLKIRSDLKEGQKRKEEEQKREEDRKMLKEIHQKVTEND